MPLSTAQTDGRYYEQFPSGRHQTGDIWTEIPNNGLLPVERSSALLITPACDLQNRKADTLVFIPIVPLSVVVRTPSLLRTFASEMKQTLRGIFPAMEELCDFFDPAFRTLLREAIESNTNTVSPKLQPNLSRLRAWVDFCDTDAITNTELAFLTEKRRSDLLERIARNSFAADMHFFSAGTLADQLPRNPPTCSLPVSLPIDVPSRSV